MRIAVDARVLGLPEIRGIASYLLQLLAHWPCPGDEFLLVVQAPLPPGRVRCPAGVTEILAPEMPGWRVRSWDWLRLPRTVRRLHPDLFFSPANTAFPLGGIPQAATVHDTLLQELVPHQGALERFVHLRLHPHWLRRHAHKVVTVSEHAKKRIHAVLGVPEERICVTHNGAARPSPAFPDKDAAREFLAHKGLAEAPYVFALGAQSPWKNTAGLLKAFALVRRQGHDAHLVVAGAQPSCRGEFLQLAEDLGIGPWVRVHGFLPAEEIHALYQGAELFVYPSLFEGFGLPVLEAMALGAPVVASDAASIPEVAGRAALLADASDPVALARAMARALGDPDLRDRLAQAGPNQAARFTWTESATRHRRIFEEVARP